MATTRSPSAFIRARLAVCARSGTRPTPPIAGVGGMALAVGLVVERGPLPETDRILEKTSQASFMPAIAPTKLAHDPRAARGLPKFMLSVMASGSAPTRDEVAPALGHGLPWRPMTGSAAT